MVNKNITPYAESLLHFCGLFKEEMSGRVASTQITFSLLCSVLVCSQLFLCWKLCNDAEVVEPVRGEAWLGVVLLAYNPREAWRLRQADHKFEASRAV